MLYFETGSLLFRNSTVVLALAIVFFAAPAPCLALHFLCEARCWLAAFMALVLDL